MSSKSAANDSLMMMMGSKNDGANNGRGDVFGNLDVVTASRDRQLQPRFIKDHLPRGGRRRPQVLFVSNEGVD